MTYVVDSLLGGLKLLGTSSAFYFTALILLGVAIIPAALRSYQLFSGNDNGWLELVVESLRVVLVVCMVIVGRGWLGLSGTAWAGLWADVSRAYRTDWLGILIKLAVVTAVILAFNAIFEGLITEGSMRTILVRLGADASYSLPTANAVIFAVKNFVVIPTYIAAMLIASGVISADGAAAVAR